MNRQLLLGGGGSPFFQGVRHQRGGGFWSRAFSSTILPALRFMGKRAATVGADVLTDISQGHDPIDAVTNRAKEEGKVLVSKASDRARKYAQTGKGRSKRSFKKKARKKTKGRKTVKRRKKNISRSDILPFLKS